MRSWLVNIIGWLASTSLVNLIINYFISRTSDIVLDSEDGEYVMVITSEGPIISPRGVYYSCPITVSGELPNGVRVDLTDKLEVGYDYVPSHYGITNCRAVKYGEIIDISPGTNISSII